MKLLLLTVVAQLSAPARIVQPVLAFPEPGFDDSAAYAGYKTRFYRDGAGNTVQVYLEGRDGRVVHLLANADNESIGFTARDRSGRPAPLDWLGQDATVDDSGRTRSLSYDLVAGARELRLGLFLLGSMRVERDLQYSGRHRRSLSGPTFEIREISAMLEALGKLPADVRRRHLGLLGARDPRALRRRLAPTVVARTRPTAWTLRVTQPSLDAADTLALEISVDPRRVAASRTGSIVTMRALRGDSIAISVRVSTTARALSALTRDEIFSSDFLAFLNTSREAALRSGTPADASRARRLERQARGVELLSSREKLMAGLPAYATYFGRDMLVSALMMRSIWREEMLEFAIASVLRKLSAAGEVSHEEALGGQAVREAAAEYAGLVQRHLAAPRRAGASPDSLLAAAEAVLRDLRRVRENYHMIDDEFQLPILVARWLADPAVTAARRRAFLADSSDGRGPRLARLLRELALVARLTAAYVDQPITANLVSFPRRDSTTWGSASWRDSGAGYGGGRYAMDVNAIWVPHALESLGEILASLRALGYGPEELAAIAPEAAGPETALARYARDDEALRRAVAAWRGADRHFVVRLGPADVRSRVAARLAALPGEERSYWMSTRVMQAGADSLTFLALSLDGAGKPIAVANSDVATRLFLGEVGGRGVSEPAAVGEMLRDVRLFTTRYPIGLFVDGVGPVVANDAYAAPDVWQRFERDLYHGPRVVWGREVNLFLLGVAQRVRLLSDTTLAEVRARDQRSAPAVGELIAALRQVAAGVEASGFHSELWSYRVEGGRVVPMRYGTGSDVQLWSTTSLAVQFALHQLGGF